MPTDPAPRGALFIVTSGPPGPGAEALVRQAYRDEGYIGEPIPIMVERALKGACEFVELETDDGRGVGPAQSGADWHPHPGPKHPRADAPELYRLGPLVAMTSVQVMLDQIDDACAERPQEDRLEIAELVADLRRELPVPSDDRTAAELTDVRTHLDDARAALDGPMEGSTPPDWGLVDLAEAVCTSAIGTRRSRDEAREALRGLLWLCDQHSGQGFLRDAAVSRARSIVEGVERTHALVALADLAGAVHIIRSHANLCEGAGLVDEAMSHRAFADRVEVRAEDDGTTDPERA